MFALRTNLEGKREKKKTEPISISIGTSTACVTSTMTFGSSF